MLYARATSSRSRRTVAQLFVTAVDIRCRARNVSTFPALTSLNLSNVGLYSIPDWVLERKRLTYLGLGANGLEAVPDALARLRGLRVLDLSENITCL